MLLLLHVALSVKRLAGISAIFPNPRAKDILADVKITRRLRNSDHTFPGCFTASSFYSRLDIGLWSLHPSPLILGRTFNSMSMKPEAGQLHGIAAER